MLDQDIVNLAKAIRQHETGNRAVKGASGEMASRYQYMPATWRSTAAKYLGDAKAPITLENENKATYLKLLDWKKSGYNPAQIASMWNSGKPEWEGNVGVNKAGVKYNVPKYVNSVYSLYQQEKTKNGSSKDLYQAQLSPQDQQSKDTYKPSQASQSSDTFGQSAQKVVSNLPSSLGGFAKGIAELFSGVTAFKAISSGINSVIQDQKPQANYKAPNALDVIKGLPKAAYDTLIPESIRATGEGLALKGASALLGMSDKTNAVANERLQAGKNALVNDPVGQTVPVLATANLLKSKSVSTKPSAIKTVVGKVGDSAKSAAEYVTSKATGLEPGTLKQIISKPERFTPDQISLYDRTSLADGVWKNVEDLMSKKSETGSGYEPIRLAKTEVVVPKIEIKTALNKFGIELDANNLIKTSRDTKPMSSADKTAIQNFITDYVDKGDVTKLTPNQFLNARESLSQMSAYDAAKTDTASAVAMKLREAFDFQGKKQIDGLKALDEDYSAQIKQFNQIKADLLTKDKETGAVVFKDGAINKIANSTGVGKDNLLARLEKIKPGITEDINILKAMEDIQRAEGNKVGTYMRILPTGAGYAAGGIVGGVIAAILSSPQVVVPLLRMFATAIGAESTYVTGVINKLKAGKTLSAVDTEFILDALKFSAIVNNLHQQESQPNDEQGNN